jgi:hypothetical protein
MLHRLPIIYVSETIRYTVGNNNGVLLTTLALVLAASESVAPMRLATRVEAAMEIENGIWKVRAVRVERILCAAK